MDMTYELIYQGDSFQICAAKLFVGNARVATVENSTNDGRQSNQEFVALLDAMTGATND